MGRDTLSNDIWRACDIMRRDNNCGGVMEYVEHMAWLLFLKFLDGQEEIFEAEAAVAGRTYTRILDRDSRWSAWVPMFLGERDPNDSGKRRTPSRGADDLLPFVHGTLFPYLRSLAGSPEAEIIAGVFSDRNVVVCGSPYNLKDVLEIVDAIDFQNEDDIHTVSHVYEDLLRKLGNENKLAGEFYTPRPVVRLMVEIVAPQIGETVYDPACGSCGFLAEAYAYLRQREQTREDNETLQRRTFFGQEKKPVPALLGLMNLILHGVMTPTVRRKNTLEENIRNPGERYGVVLTNPPFGGTENAQIQQNFPVKAQATELLFLQHIMKKLKATPGSRCGMVVPEGTLFRGGAFATVKRELLETYNLHSVISLPPGTFAPYSDVKTALLFFERPGPTRETWYHEVPLPEGLKKFSKGKPIQDDHLAEAREAWKRLQAYWCGARSRPETTSTSWVETAETVAARGFDLSAKNPTRLETEKPPHPVELTATLLERNRELHAILENLHSMLGNDNDEGKETL